jgi:putative transcriptional regulator
MNGWFLLLLLLAVPALAQQAEAPNGILLIAKENLRDPNFSQTVVLVTQAQDGGTVGVILNRPSGRKHPASGAEIFTGGPVMREVVVAVFQAERAPPAPAFHVLRGIYLSMHPDNVDPLLAGSGTTRHRLYMGFSGWAPGQLESEMRQEGWHVLPASDEIVFRTETSGMWRELVEKARGGRAESRTIPRRTASY